MKFDIWGFSKNLMKFDIWGFSKNLIKFDIWGFSKKLTKFDIWGVFEKFRYSPTLSLTSALHWGGWSTPRPGRFTPGKDPVPIVQEAGWAPGQNWTGAGNLAAIGIRSQDRPTRSESLYLYLLRV